MLTVGVPHYLKILMNSVGYKVSYLGLVVTGNWNILKLMVKSYSLDWYKLRKLCSFSFCLYRVEPLFGTHGFHLGRIVLK